MRKLCCDAREFLRTFQRESPSLVNLEKYRPPLLKTVNIPELFFEGLQVQLRWRVVARDNQLHTDWCVSHTSRARKWIQQQACSQHTKLLLPLRVLMCRHISSYRCINSWPADNIVEQVRLRQRVIGRSAKLQLSSAELETLEQRQALRRVGNASHLKELQRGAKASKSAKRAYHHCQQSDGSSRTNGHEQFFEGRWCDGL